MTPDRQTSVSRPTIVFFPEGAYGPTNNCVGIGQVLQSRGARVVFIVEESFAGTLEARGFEERVMRLGPRPEVPEAPGQFWKDFIRDTAPEYRKPTVDQLGTVIAPIWEQLIAGAKYVDERLREILAEVGPDVVVEDNVVGFPAILASGVPWARIVSCNPLELRDPGLPPIFSGFPISDPSAWPAFEERYDELHGPMHEDFSRYMQDRGAPPLPGRAFIHESPFLNLYLYPEAADYPRRRPLGATWHNLGTCVRQPDTEWSPPQSLGEGGRLIYLSLGSLGSADVDLMQRFIDLLAQTEHRVVVSLGPRHSELRLPPRMWGEELVPQPAILPWVDLVITHGGNNTVTESFFHGKPMVLHPLFWDQHDNAQRVSETGYGVRLPAYSFTDDRLFAAIDQLLADGALANRMRVVSADLQSRPGTIRAADLVLRLAEGRQAVTREPVE